MQGETIEKLTRAGLNMIQQALSIFDSDLRLAVCNNRYQEMFGLPDAYVTPGARFEDTIRFLVERGEYGEQPDPEAAVRLRVEMARAFEPHYMERKRANGRWISVEGAPLTEGGWVTVYTDITEIKLQEELLRSRSAELSHQLVARSEHLAQTNRELAATNAALAEAKRSLIEIEARTRLVTEMMPAHIAHVDRELVYTFSNRRLSAVMPGAPSNVVGLHASVALGPITFARIHPFMLKALAGEPALCEITHEDSGRRIRVALTPDPGTAGFAADGIFILSTDITEEAQARAAVMQTRKRELAAQLTSGLAHDFANLLTIIMGLQGKLAALPDLPGTASDLSRATMAAARRGGNLLSRIGKISDTRQLRPERIDLEVLLDDLRMMASPSLPEGLRLGIDLEPGLGAVMLDPGALQDSLLNLILNARDAMAGQRGTIGLTARRGRDTWLELSVEDSGPGFSDAALAHALEPFFTTKGGEGSGLGLAMVFDQASMAGGTVRLANRPEGGARVTLRLPLRLAQQAEETTAQLVLLVEDNAEIRTAVRDTLCAMGHQVVEAETAEDARVLVQIPEVSFVLSDIQLRGAETGLDLVAGLSHLRPELPAALMTSLPASAPLRQTAAAAFDVLPKPVDPGDLQAVMARLAPRRAVAPAP
ncbi:MAG: PAS-domain containing protein [Paracoccaceae bacterium]